MALSSIATSFVDIGANLNPLKAGLAQAKGLASAAGSGIGSGLMAGLGALGLAAGVGASIAIMVKNFSEAEAAEQGLAAALESRGMEVEGTMQRYKGLAAAIQQTTTIEGDSVLPIIQSGLQMGMSAQQAEEYTKAAIGLAKVAGVDVKEAMTALGKAANGSDMALKRMLPQLGDSKNATETLSRASDLATTGMEQQFAATSTSAGMWAQIKNEFGDITETIGGMIAGGLMPCVTWFRDLLATINQFSASASNDMGSVAGAAQSLLGGVVGSVFSFLGTLISETIFRLMTFSYYGRQLGNAFVIGFGTIMDVGSWAFTNLMNLLSWFGDNWRTIFKDIFNFAVAIFTNLGENIKRFFTNTWAFIRSGGKTTAMQGFVGLADNFVAETKKMPEYTKYAFGEVTKEGMRGWDAENKAQDEQKKKWDEILTKQAEKKKEMMNELAKPADLKLTETGVNKEADKKKKGKDSTGSFVGALEAWKQLQTASVKSEGEKIAADQLKIQNKMEKHLAKMAEKDDALELAE